MFACLLGRARACFYIRMSKQQAEAMNNVHKKKMHTCTTVAVNPAALEPLPEVYTEMGACESKLQPNELNQRASKKACMQLTPVIVFLSLSLTLFPSLSRTHSLYLQLQLTTLDANLRNWDLAVEGSPSSSILMHALSYSYLFFTLFQSTHHFGCKLEELGLGSGRVSQQQHIDVSSPLCAVRQGLRESKREHTQINFIFNTTWHTVHTMA